LTKLVTFTGFTEYFGKAALFSLKLEHSQVTLGIAEAGANPTSKVRGRFQ